MKTSIAIGALALAAIAGSASQALGGVVSSGPVNINVGGVPPGVFLNVVTGEVGTAFGGVPGFDVNLFGFGSTLTVSGPLVNGQQSPTGGFARLNSGLNIANLSGGVLIGNLPNMFWQTVNAGVSTSSPAGAPFLLNSTDNYAGFRFLNEATGQVHYGYLRLSIGSTLATRSIIEYAYEDVAGASILVPTPGAAAVLGLGGLLAARRRR